MGVEPVKTVTPSQLGVVLTPRLGLKRMSTTGQHQQTKEQPTEKHEQHLLLGFHILHL